MRNVLRYASTPLGVAGLAAVTVGAAQLADWAGWMVGGVGALYVSWRLDTPTPKVDA